MEAGLLMVILVLPKSWEPSIGQPPLAEFLVDDEGPLIGIGDIDEEGVVALGGRSGRRS